MLQNFEERVNEELINSVSNINLDLDALEPDVVNENENIIDGDGKEVLLDRNIVYDINHGYSFVDTEDEKHHKEYLDANAIAAKHTLLSLIIITMIRFMLLETTAKIFLK